MGTTIPAEGDHKACGCFVGQRLARGSPAVGAGSPPLWCTALGDAAFPVMVLITTGEGPSWCPGGVPCGDGDGVPGLPRYRCLVDMWSNVIPNGANCVEMLRNLCPVSPSMYYVGVSKVQSWPWLR